MDRLQWQPEAMILSAGSRLPYFVDLWLHPTSMRTWLVDSSWEPGPHNFLRGGPLSTYAESR